MKYIAIALIVLAYGIAGQLDFAELEPDPEMKRNRDAHYFDGCRNMVEPHRQICYDVQALKLTFKY